MPGADLSNAAGLLAWLLTCWMRGCLCAVQAAWRLVVPASSSAVPSARLGMASASYDSAGLWYIFGGWTASAGSSVAFLSDLWRFTFDTQTWQLVAQPPDATEAPPPCHT